MNQISSFKVAAGIAGIVALVKLSTFAIALAMLGAGSSVVNSPSQTSVPDNRQIVARF